jgi:hypothetical protein
MSKLYIFGIGGTGSRVLKSLTMLLAAGVDCGVDIVVPIVIDRDASNGDYTRTETLIKHYITVNNKMVISSDKSENKFFKTKIELLNNELLLQLNDNTQKFDAFIGKTTMNKENQALIEMLFSKKTLDMDMTAGFQGNPNIGSIVLNQFDENDIFKAFANDFTDPKNKIFIISSIFGGTGASGFPLLRKVLKTTNQKDALGNVLANWGHINKANIGAITVLPYFNVSSQKSDTDKDSQVDSDTFIDKAKAALTYYETEDKKLDTLYYIADNKVTTYNHHKGGDDQKNYAHFVELAAAMAILDFANPANDVNNINRDSNHKITKTIYKEFGIAEDSKDDFALLDNATQKLIVNPLSRFLLFAKYLGYRVTEEIKDGKTIKVVNIDKKNIFDVERKHQPYANKPVWYKPYPKLFDKDFRKTGVIKSLESVQEEYVKWLLEMENQERKFIPFNLETKDAQDFVMGEINIEAESLLFKNWAKVDNELNRQSGKIDKALKTEERFMELFYRVSESLLKQTI